MEAERYRRVCAVVDQACPHRRGRGQQFGDHLIVKVYVWGVLHDRPTVWACDPRNWPDDDDGDGLRPPALPSQPTMSRRLRTVGVLPLLERAPALLAAAPPPAPLKHVDSKPLAVGNYSKDPDARRGRAAGAMARGYKLHAVQSGGVLRYW